MKIHCGLLTGKNSIQTNPIFPLLEASLYSYPIKFLTQNTVLLLFFMSFSPFQLKWIFRLQRRRCILRASENVFGLFCFHLSSFERLTNDICHQALLSSHFHVLTRQKDKMMCFWNQKASRLVPHLVGKPDSHYLKPAHLTGSLSVPLSPSDWIQELSTYATSSLLRAATIGAEIQESWVVENAAVYLWNYNSQLLAAGEYQRLLPVFQTVVELLQKTDNNGYATPSVEWLFKRGVIAGLAAIALDMMLSLLSRSKSIHGWTYPLKWITALERLSSETHFTQSWLLSGSRYSLL